MAVEQPAARRVKVSEDERCQRRNLDRLPSPFFTTIIPPATETLPLQLPASYSNAALPFAKRKGGINCIVAFWLGLMSSLDRRLHVPMQAVGLKPAVLGRRKVRQSRTPLVSMHCDYHEASPDLTYLGRLRRPRPTLNPNTCTLLVCGYLNAMSAHQHL